MCKDKDTEHKDYAALCLRCGGEKDCPDVIDDNKWYCATNYEQCKNPADPDESDEKCCTTEVRKKCYQNCLPRNYSTQLGDEGSIPSMAIDMPNNQTYSSWCMAPLLNGEQDCQKATSAHTGASIETDAFCMDKARRVQTQFANHPSDEVMFLGHRMAYPGLTKDSNGIRLPWADLDEWKDGGECSTPDYNSRGKMTEQILYLQGCGSIQDNPLTKSNWTRTGFSARTQINLPSAVTCDLSTKDLEELISFDEDEQQWKTNENGAFADQPFCKEKHDENPGDCRQYCWDSCKVAESDYSRLYTQMLEEAEAGKQQAIDASISSFAMTAAAIGAGVIMILLFFSSGKGGISDEERIMQELEDDD
jgi:hypothetical protein